jgi:diamine N-acetyltransferase
MIQYLADGKRIALRKMVSSDESLIYAWENNTENWLISDTRQSFSKEMIHAFVHQHQDIKLHQQLRLMMVEKEKNRVVGAVDLFEYDGYHNRVGIGILVAEVTDRGNGYGKEALLLTLEYVFNSLKVNQAFCNILESNSRSIRLFESVGFQRVGVKKEWVYDGKGYINEVMYQYFKP